MNNMPSPYSCVGGAHGGPGFLKEPLFNVPFSGMINYSSRFVEDEKQTSGMILFTEKVNAVRIQRHISRSNGCPLNSFPVQWPIPFSLQNMERFIKHQYLVTLKPLGTRYLLYVDLDGKLFMENVTQHIFKLSKSFQVGSALQRLPKDTILDGIVVRKNIQVLVAKQEGELVKGELVFVIMDATRIKGQDLTGTSILSRMDAAQKLVKRLAESHKKDKGPVDKEVFDIDIVKYEGLNNVKEYLGGFDGDYPVGSFIFKPLYGGYRGDGEGLPVVEYNPHPDVLFPGESNFFRDELLASLNQFK